MTEPSLKKQSGQPDHGGGAELFGLDGGTFNPRERCGSQVQAKETISHPIDKKQFCPTPRNDCLPETGGDAHTVNVAENMLGSSPNGSAHLQDPRRTVQDEHEEQQARAMTFLDLDGLKHTVSVIGKATAIDALEQRLSSYNGTQTAAKEIAQPRHRSPPGQAHVAAPTGPEFGPAGSEVTRGAAVFISAGRGEMSREQSPSLSDIVAGNLADLATLLAERAGEVALKRRMPAPALPTEASVFYGGNSADGDPLKFSEKHYEVWLKARVLDLESLGRLDPKLLHALRRTYRGEKLADLKAVFPSISEARDNRSDENDVAMRVVGRLASKIRTLHK